jgi:hypothetical protein
VHSRADWLCTKIVEKLEKCRSPHFSSGVKMGVPAPLLRAGFYKNRIFVHSRADYIRKLFSAIVDARASDYRTSPGKNRKLPLNS